jgi:hypothetical protein
VIAAGRRAPTGLLRKTPKSIDNQRYPPPGTPSTTATRPTALTPRRKFSRPGKILILTYRAGQPGPHTIFLTGVPIVVWRRGFGARSR